MDFERWLTKLADFLVKAGVPAEHGPMAALGLVFLSLTLLSLIVVVLLLRRKIRPGEVRDEVSAESLVEEPETTDEVATEEVTTPGEVEEVFVEEPPPTLTTVPEVEEPANLYQRMRQGLARTRSSLPSTSRPVAVCSISPSNAP